MSRHFKKRPWAPFVAELPAELQRPMRRMLRARDHAAAQRFTWDLAGQIRGNDRVLKALVAVPMLAGQLARMVIEAHGETIGPDSRVVLSVNTTGEAETPRHRALHLVEHAVNGEALAVAGHVADVPDPDTGRFVVACVALLAWHLVQQPRDVLSDADMTWSAADDAAVAAEAGA